MTSYQSTRRHADSLERKRGKAEPLPESPLERAKRLSRELVSVDELVGLEREPLSANIELPWPPKELTPNAKRRKHWSVYRKPAANYRELCFWLTVQHLRAEGLAISPSGLRIHSVTFYPPDRRCRDDDGMIGAFKAGRDGVADALGVDDHTFRPQYHFAEPVKNGRVVIVIGA